MAASEKSCGRPPAPPAAWIHHIHTVGGANGSTMVMLLSCCCAFCAVVCAFCAISSGCHLSSYVDKYERITLGRVIDETKCPTQACTIPQWERKYPIHVSSVKRYFKPWSVCLLYMVCHLPHILACDKDMYVALTGIVLKYS